MGGSESTSGAKRRTHKTTKHCLTYQEKRINNTKKSHNKNRVGRTHLYPSVHPFQQSFGWVHSLVDAAVVFYELGLRHLRALLLPTKKMLEIVVNFGRTKTRQRSGEGDGTSIRVRSLSVNLRLVFVSLQVSLGVTFSIRVPVLYLIKNTNTPKSAVGDSTATTPPASCVDAPASSVDAAQR